MAELEHDVERIVREVLARMSAPPQQASPATPALRPPSSAAPRSGDLILAERVVTLASITERLAQVTRLVVGPRAVITPAVRDLLHERRITIDRQPANVAARPGVRLLAWAQQAADLTALEPLLAADGIGFEIVSAADLPAAIRRLASAVAGSNRLAVLMTDAASAAVCLANRRRGVQAVSGGDPAAVADAVRNIAANLLVVAAGLPPTALRPLLAAFCHTLPRACRPQYQAAL